MSIFATGSGFRWVFAGALVVLLGRSAASAAPLAYMANSLGGTVSVIDTGTNAVVATVAVGGGPEGTAVNHTGSRVYVSNFSSASVSVIDTATNTVTATVPVGTQPDGIAVNPAGTFVYGANFGGATVSVIDAASDTVTATIPVGTQPLGVAVNPTGTRAYVANYGGGNVSVVDTGTNSVTATVTVGSSPWGVAMHSAGTFVYVANFGSNNVSVIDTATDTVTATIAVGSEPIGVAVNPAGTHLYAVNDNAGSVSVIDTATNTVTATISVGSLPHGVAFTPAGTFAYVGNYGGTTLSVIDTATNTVTATVGVGSGPAGFGQFIVPAGCGDDLIGTGEDCDAGAANGTINSCCTASCAFQTAGATCPGGTCDAMGGCVVVTTTTSSTSTSTSSSTTTSSSSTSSTSSSTSTTTSTSTSTTLPCDPAPATGCKMAGASSLVLKNNADDTKDSLKWKWAKGALTDLTDFMNPQTGSATYRVCVYDASANTQPRMEMDVPPGGTCGALPCWKLSGQTGVGYKNKAATPNGITDLKLKSGAAGKASVQVKGKGANLPMFVLGLPTPRPVTIQLVITDGATRICWQSAYTTLKADNSAQLSAKTP